MIDSRAVLEEIVRVKCIINDLGRLSDQILRLRLAESVHIDGPDYDLVIGETYAVLALEQWSDGGLRVYLHTVADSDHPYPYPIEIFDVVDAALPVGWCVGSERKSSGVLIKIISFPEWAKDAYFYERLVDGEGAAVEVYKARMAEMGFLGEAQIDGVRFD